MHRVNSVIPYNVRPQTYKYTVELYDLWLILNWKVPGKKHSGLTRSFILAFIWRNLKSKENLSVYPISQPRLLFVLLSLVTGLFLLVLLLKQRWSPPLRLQVSHCSTFRIMCDVPSIAVFCNESIECFPGTASKFFLKLLVTIQLLLLLSSSLFSANPYRPVVTCVPPVLRFENFTVFW